MKLVRLYPYTPHLGFVRMVYTHIRKGRPYKFVGANGWYQIDDSLADELKGISQEDRYPLQFGGKPAFMVASDREEASNLQEAFEAMLHGVKGGKDRVGTLERPIALRPGMKSSGDEDLAPRKEAKPRSRRKASSSVEE